VNFCGQYFLADSIVCGIEKLCVMISNISWASYWTALIVLLLIYYGFVLVRFYGADIRRWLSPRERSGFGALSTAMKEAETNRDTFPTKSSAEEPLAPTINESDSVLIVKALLDEFLAFLEQAGEAQMQKPEILYGLTQIVGKYPFHPDSGEKSTINGIIINEAKEKCSIHVSEEEMVHVWLDT
jgi:hypothetical protein